MIWRYALPEPKLVDTYHRQDVVYPRIIPNPVLLSVNRESRALAKKHYQWTQQAPEYFVDCPYWYEYLGVPGDREVIQMTEYWRKFGRKIQTEPDESTSPVEPKSYYRAVYPDKFTTQRMRKEALKGVPNRAGCYFDPKRDILFYRDAQIQGDGFWIQGWGLWFNDHAFKDAGAAENIGVSEAGIQAISAYCRNWLHPPTLSECPGEAYMYLKATLFPNIKRLFQYEPSPGSAEFARWENWQKVYNEDLISEENDKCGLCDDAAHRWDRHPLAETRCHAIHGPDPGCLFWEEYSYQDWLENEADMASDMESSTSE